MKYFVPLILIFGSAALLTSCNEDTFSQVVQFEVPKVQNKLVVNCNYTIGDDTLQVLVGKTRNVGETINTDGLENCRISLYRDNVFLTEIPHVGKYFDENARIYRLGGMKNLISPRGVYRLKVEHREFETVAAVQEIPEPPALSNPFFQQKAFLVNDIFNTDVKYDLIGFELKDPRGEHFYMISAESILRDTINRINERASEFFNLDNVFSNGGIFDDLGNINHYITDERFDGKKFDIRLGFAPVNRAFFSRRNPSFELLNAKRLKIILHVYSISKQKFLYENSIEAKNQSLGNFFGESVTVNSNIENGYGIFSIRNAVTSVINVP